METEFSVMGGKGGFGGGAFLSVPIGLGKGGLGGLGGLGLLGGLGGFGKGGLGGLGLLGLGGGFGGHHGGPGIGGFGGPGKKGRGAGIIIQPIIQQAPIIQAGQASTTNQQRMALRIL